MEAFATYRSNLFQAAVPLLLKAFLTFSGGGGGVVMEHRQHGIMCQVLFNIFRTYIFNFDLEHQFVK